MLLTSETSLQYSVFNLPAHPSNTPILDTVCVTIRKFPPPSGIHHLLIIVDQDGSITSLPVNGDQVLSEVGRLLLSGLLGSNATHLRMSSPAGHGGAHRMKQRGGETLG